MEKNDLVYSNNDLVYVFLLKRLELKIAKRKKAGRDTTRLEQAAVFFGKVLNPGERFDPQRQFMS